MKLLRLRTKHSWGRPLLCNGTLYQISSDGMVRVSDKDADKLLQADCWDAVSELEPEKCDEPEPAMLDAEPENLEPVEPELGSIDEESDGEADEEDESLPPTPTMAMKKSELIELARLYQVPEDDLEAATKPELIRLIDSKMFEADD